MKPKNIFKFLKAYSLVNAPCTKLFVYECESVYVCACASIVRLRSAGVFFLLRSFHYIHRAFEEMVLCEGIEGVKNRMCKH